MELSKAAQIAGSIRRQKPEVKDIEIVAIPEPTHNIFLEEDWSRPTYLDYQLRHMESDDELEMIKGGRKYRQYRLAEGINLDLFLVYDAAQWGVIYLIRTGPWEFSRWMVTQRNLGGALPSNAYVKDGLLRVGGRYDYNETNDSMEWTGGEIVPILEEVDYFRLCRMEYIEPAERRPMWRR